MSEEKDKMIIEVPDIPMPEGGEDSSIIKDECEGAFKFAFIGVGQGGSRIVESFSKLGYRRVCCVNTTSLDLAAIAIPDANKLVMDIGTGGAGKEPGKGAQAVKAHYEDVYDLMRRSFGREFDRIFVCLGAGGGCVLEGTNVFIEGKGFVPIEHVWQDAMANEKNGAVPVFDLETHNRMMVIDSLGWFTWGFDAETGQTVMRRIKAVHQMDVPLDCRTKVLMSNSSEVVVSDWHPFFVLRTGEDSLPEIAEVSASKMKAGMLSFAPLADSKASNVSTRDLDVAWLAGLFAGDGHLEDEWAVSFTTMDEDIASRIRDVCERHFKNNKGLPPTITEMAKPNNRAKTYRVHAKSVVNAIRALVEGVSTNKTHTWSVSSAIQSDFDMGNAFLAGLMASDGYVGRKCTGISLANKKAIEQVGLMLSLRGVDFSMREKSPAEPGWHTMYSVEISEKGRARLSGMISGLIHCARKEKGLHELSYQEEDVLDGFDFSFVDGIFKAVRLCKSGPDAKMHLLDEDGSIDISAWVFHGAFPRRRTVRRLLSVLLSRHDELMSMDLSLADARELCRIAGIRKKDLRRLFGAGSHVANEIWSNRCGEDIRSRLQTMARAHLQCALFESVPSTIALLRRSLESIVKVEAVSKTEDGGMFYDFTVDGCSSYCAGVESLCFVHNTGSGACNPIIEIAHDIAQALKVEAADGPPAVGAIVSLPKVSEGSKVNLNACEVLESLFRQVGEDRGKLAGRTLSPLILVDNDRINKIYPNVPVTNFWTVANQSISTLFHLFNSIATKDSDFTTFDKADFKDLLDSGVVSFGACPIVKWDQLTDISYAIRDNLRKNVLVGNFNLNQARSAGCIFIGNQDVLAKIPQENLEHGFEMLTRIMRENSVVHRGIYKGNKPGLVVYSILGELGRPTERMEEIAKTGGATIKR